MAQTKKPLGSRMFRLVAGLVFCWMLLLNCLTPYLADDYTFAYAFDTGERLHSLPQLISSLVFHYHEWSGRVIVKFFAQGFTMFPKLLFNVCNAGMFMALGLVLYKLAVGRHSQKEDWLALALRSALYLARPICGCVAPATTCGPRWDAAPFCCPGGIICSSRLPVRRAWRPAWRWPGCWLVG